MARRSTILGASAAFVAVILVVLLVWFITDDADRTASAKDPAGVFFDHLKPCTADRATGICYAQTTKQTTTFQSEAFEAMVRESGARSASSAAASTAWMSNRPVSAQASCASSRHSVSSRCRFRFSPRAFPRTATGALAGDMSSAGTGAIVGRDRAVGSRPSGRCRRDRSLLGIFGVDDLTRGAQGWTFPVLLNGDCPITAAMLKAPGTGRGFGGPLNDF